MDPVTHVTTGLLLSQLIPGPSRAWSAVAGLIFTLLPDIDYFLVWFDRLAFIRYHRGFTHSLLAVPLFVLLVAAVGRALGGPRWFRPLLLLGLAVLGAHLLLDLATSYGTQIFNPLSRRRFSLDWIFIIDPYFTALLLAGTVAALLSPTWGRRVGAVCLALAGGYFLLCGCYHHQALNLARRVFRVASRPAPEVAALPQPFSLRRWYLIAASPGEIRQVFVELPYGACLGRASQGLAVEAATMPPAQVFPVPPPYQTPPNLVVQTWRAAPEPPLSLYPPEAREIVERYLEFARFPLLHRVQSLGGGQVLEWLDLRFSVPGRALPFVLQLHLDAQGRLNKWLIGRGREEEK